MFNQAVYLGKRWVTLYLGVRTGWIAGALCLSLIQACQTADVPPISPITSTPVSPPDRSPPPETPAVSPTPKYPLDAALLYPGADINARFKGNGFTALMVAAQRGDADRAKILLNAGANVKGLDGAKALVLATKSNSLEIVQALLQRGVSPNTYMDVLQMQDEAEKPPDEGLLVLRQAVRMNNLALVQQLLAAGANPNLRENPQADSIVLEAMFNNPYISFLAWDLKTPERYPTPGKPRVEIVKELIRKGANPNDRSHNGTTPLMLAAAQAQPELVTLLIQQGAVVNQRNVYGDTPLVYAAWRGSPEVVKILLRHKANVNTPSNGFASGRTPLMFAVRRGSLEVVKLLLEHRANVNAFSTERKIDRVLKSESMTVLDHAIATGNMDIIALLKQHGAKSY